MIAYLSGKIILKKDNSLILEVNGLGYEVFLSNHSISNIANKGDNLNLFCHLDVGERSLKLYGFLTHQELELFKIIRNISGVGPKAALEISSVGSLDKIKDRIDQGNFLEGVSGIGKKKAQKIILELSGKINSFKEDEALPALVELGFSKERAKKALSGVKETETEKRIEKALKILGQV